MEMNCEQSGYRFSAHRARQNRPAVTANAGRLSGRMKLGTALDHATLARFHHFFGVAPLRINNKEETHLDFDRLVKEATQAQWLNKIGRRLGRPVLVAQSRAIEQEASVIISRLKLAFPKLSMITDRLGDPKSCTHDLFFFPVKTKKCTDDDRPCVSNRPNRCFSFVQQ